VWEEGFWKNVLEREGEEGEENGVQEMVEEAV
jgi:hypothetical protein